MGSREEAISASQRRSVSRICASMRRRPRRACRSTHWSRTTASRCSGRWRRARARMPWLLACTSSSSSMRSASSTSGMSLPLAAMCWAASCSGMPCDGEASTRSMAWLVSTWASSAASCGRHGRTAMPLLRRVLTMASAFSPLSSTISRRMVMSFAFCMHCSPICESRYTMRGEPSMRVPLARMERRSGSHHAARCVAAGPGPLEVVAAQPAGHVQHLANEVQAGDALGFHR